MAAHSRAGEARRVGEEFNLMCLQTLLGRTLGVESRAIKNLHGLLG